MCRTWNSPHARRNVPARVEIRDLGAGAMVKLATERKKHLTDIIKMLAYQAESDLLNLLRPHYPATLEGPSRDEHKWNASFLSINTRNGWSKFSFTAGIHPDIRPAQPQRHAGRLVHHRYPKQT
jgi:hypothetical protein